MKGYFHVVAETLQSEIRCDRDEANVIANEILGALEKHGFDIVRADDSQIIRKHQRQRGWLKPFG